MTKLILALIFLTLLVIPFGISCYGLILAFKASIVLGFIVLLIEPSPLVLGLIALCGHPEIATKIAQWLGLA